jgi:hypothetical protein
MTTIQEQRRTHWSTAWLTPTRLRWLAWLLAGLTLPLMVGTVYLVWLGRASLWRAEGEYSLAYQVFAVLGNGAAPIIGALIAARQPRNPYGWIWLVSGLALSFTQLAATYAFHGLLIAPRTLPLAKLALSLTSPAWFLYLATAPFVLLLFPTGRLPSPKWRIIGWVVVGALMFGLALGWAMPELSSFVPVVEHPDVALGVVNDVTEGVVVISELLIYTAILAGAVALLLRFRRATGVERQQLKWFTYGGMLVGMVLISDFFYAFPGVWESIKEDLVFNLLPPLMIGIAILRYRLYDIDLLIRRTLVYTVLTACLAFVYFSSVVGLQSLVRTSSGPARHSLVTVLSTLAIAALFTPLRRRIQEGIDRRFYRRKYDAEQILAIFRTTVRNETDLDRLCAALVIVIQETMQPASLRIWLKPASNHPAGHLPAGEKPAAAKRRLRAPPQVETRAAR